MRKVNKDIVILSIAFLFVTGGFGPVQRYLTTFFSDIGSVNVGFLSLVLIYAFFAISNPISVIFISKYGSRKSLILGSLFYFIFIFSLISKSELLVYIASILLGFGASLFWMGQNSYLIHKSKSKDYGKNSGFFNSLRTLGPALGVLVLGFLIKKFSFILPFILFSIISLIGFFILFKLEDIKPTKRTNNFKLIKNSFKSPTALRLSTILFAFNFTFGLSIGIIPLQIKNVLGVEYVGIFMSFFFLLPILLSFFIGVYSDNVGRKKMIIFQYIFSIVSLLILYFYSSGIFFIFGIMLLALSSAVIPTITSPFFGDISDKNNLEVIASLFWIVQQVGVVLSLLLSIFIKSEIMYLILIFVLSLSFFIILPLLKFNFNKIRMKLSKEIENL